MWGEHGQALAKKPTRWLTNAACVAAALDLKCDGSHEHVPLLNGRAKGAQQYPPQLCRAIVSGFKRQLEQDLIQEPLREQNQGPLFNLEILAVDPEDNQDQLREELAEEQSWAEWEASDDVHGGVLPAHLVHAARVRELRYLQDRQVYAHSTWSEAIQRTGRRPLKLKWIDTNKGDAVSRNLRSRLVCTEVRRKGTEAIYSATPPMESLRAIVAKAASEDPCGQRDPYKLLLVDVSRAHFYAKATRDVYIELPREDPRSQQKGVCGKLLKTMYGTLDAAAQWAAHYTQVLTDAGFVQGLASPCHFHHPELDIWVLVHGDDFFCAARAAGRRHLQEVLSAAYETKQETAGPHPEDPKELRVLGRIVTYREDGLTIEADPSHLEMVVDALGLENAKSVVSPGQREDSGITQQELLERRLIPALVPDDTVVPAPLQGEQFDLYRSMAARLLYYGLDRPDVQFATKELMRKLGAPDEEHWMSLKRLTRYLLGAQRSLARYPWAPLPSVLTVYVDSDHAGCQRTRKSTLGGVIAAGTHFIKAWSSTMPILALSSGEAELAAVCKGGQEGLGVQSLFGDFGVKIGVELKSDATAAIGICRRNGLGRVRHLAVSDLWIQQKVRCGDIGLGKTPGKENPADALTKYKSLQESFRLLSRVGLVLAPGRPRSAPQKAKFVIGSRAAVPEGFIQPTARS